MPRTLIFDLGGVLVRTRDQALRARWEEALGLSPGEAEQVVFRSDMGRRAQLGEVSDAEHWRWIQQHLQLAPEALDRFRRDFFLNDEVDRDLVDYVRRLRGYYSIGLLSNASSGLRALLVERYGILDLFDHITISAEEGVMKPDPRIYTIALARAGVQPGEAVYVDDFLENVAAARALGMHAIHFVDPAVAYAELVRLTGIPFTR